MQFLDDYFLPLLFFVVAVLTVFAVALGLSTTLEHYQCGKYESVTGKPTRYEGMSCYVQDTGNWYAWTEYKHRLATKGEFSK